MVLGKRQDLIHSPWYRVILVLRGIALAISALLFLGALIFYLMKPSIRPLLFFRDLSLGPILIVLWLVIEKIILFVVTGSANLSTDKWFNFQRYKLAILSVLLVPPFVTLGFHERINPAEMKVSLYDLKDGQTRNVKYIEAEIALEMCASAINTNFSYYWVPRGYYGGEGIRFEPPSTELVPPQHYRKLTKCDKDPYADLGGGLVEWRLPLEIELDAHLTEVQFKKDLIVFLISAAVIAMLFFSIG
jgi:hypothetical protein